MRRITSDGRDSRLSGGYATCHSSAPGAQPNTQWADPSGSCCGRCNSSSCTHTQHTLCTTESGTCVSPDRLVGPGTWQQGAHSLPSCFSAIFKSQQRCEGRWFGGNSTRGAQLSNTALLLQLQRLYNIFLVQYTCPKKPLPASNRGMRMYKLLSTRHAAAAAHTQDC
jgi:hypothetical protein